MKKNMLIIAAAVLIGGCGAFKPDKDAVPVGPEPVCDTNRPLCSGGMVLAVNGELITVNEVVTPQLEELRPMGVNGDYLDFRRRAKSLVEESIKNRISNIVLHQKAKKEVAEGIDEQLEKAANEEIRHFLIGYGGNYAEAEVAIKNMGLDWKSFKEYQKKLILVQYFLSEELKEKRPITYSEMTQYYEDARNEQFFSAATVQFRVIDILPDQVDSNDPNISRRDAAIKLAQDLTAKLKQGGSFESLAKQYSMDSARAHLGGLWSSVTIGSLAAPYDVLESEAQKLEIGQVSSPIEADGHIFIIKLENKTAESYQPFEDVQHKIEMNIKMARRKDTVDKLVDKLIAQAEVGDKNMFLEMCLQKAYQSVSTN